MSAVMSAPRLALSKLMHVASLYLPIAIMAVLALGTWWLARNTPLPPTAAPERPVRHEPDYLLTNFSVKNFDASGKLVSEVMGAQARHFPDTDILEIDQARMRSARDMRIATGSSNRAYSNGDGSEVQLVGNARVVREPIIDAQGKAQPRMEFQSEFLHAFVTTEQFKSHKPVVITRGADRFAGDSMFYDHLNAVFELQGRVQVKFEARQ
jgi:lipopolysaccharide export system protein LptC